MIIPILILATILRLLFLGQRPFDGDEGLILKLANFDGLGEIFLAAKSDVQPPLVYFVTYFSRAIFGTSEFGSRFFPALFGIGVVWLTILSFRRLFNHRVGNLAGLLTASSTLPIYASQELRPYIFLTFFFLGAFLAVLKIRQKGRLIDWLGFIISAIGLVYSQYIGWPMLGFLLAMLGWKKIQPSLASLGLISLVYLPQWPMMVHQFKNRLAEQAVGFLPRVNIIGLMNGFYRFGAGRIFLDLEGSPGFYYHWLKTQPFNFTFFVLTLLVPAIIFFIGLATSFRQKGTKTTLWLLIFALVLGFFFAEIGSRASRTLLLVAPFYYGLVSVGLVWLWGKKWLWSKLLILGLATIFVVSLYNYYQLTLRPPGEKQVAQELSEKVSANEVIYLRGAFGGGESFVLAYYWPKDKPQPVVVDYYGDYQVGNLAAIRQVKIDDKIHELLQTYPAVWFYDFAYGQDADEVGQKRGVSPEILGNDKENKPIKIWKYEK